jgi:hypothetical protein
MKRNIFYLLMLLVFFTACEDKDNDITKYDIGSNIVVAASTFTTLDNTVALKCTAAFNVSTVDVTFGSTNLGQITITDGKGTLNVPITSFPTLTSTSSKAVTVTYTAYAEDGTAIVRTSTVTLVTPFTVTAHSITQTGIDSLFYTIAPKIAKVNSFSLQSKVNFDGTYSDYPGSYTTKKDTVLIDGRNYHAGDTLYIKIAVASDAGKSDIYIQKVPIGSYFTATAIARIDTAANRAYDLLKRRNVDLKNYGDSADVVFTHSLIVGGFNLGFKTPFNAEFVKTTGEFYDLGDILAIRATDFSSAVTSVDAVAVGDAFIYRTKRGNGSYKYGIFKVVTVGKPEGVVEDSYLEFEIPY